MPSPSAGTTAPSQGTKVAEADWIGFNSVFYNTRTGAFGENVNDLIAAADIEFHPEGLLNYLEFGYSVLGQTPLRNIRYLRPCASLHLSGGRFTEVPGEDHAAARLKGPESTVEGVKEDLRRTVSAWEKSGEGPIIIPTSGGLDSRLLNFLIQDKTRLRAYTYGISDKQEESYEVVYARALCAKLGVAWERIPLRRIHDYFGQWDTLFGISTHAHGMYQMDFYDRIREKEPAGSLLLSGIVGDVWAGSVWPSPIANPRDLHLLGHSHGVSADSSQCKTVSKFELREEFFECHRRELDDVRWRVLAVFRFKMILLRYLLRVPVGRGFRPWSPFLESGPSLEMLMLPEADRRDRTWQKEWFSREGLMLEDLGLKVSKENSLDLSAIKTAPPPPLNEKALARLFQPEYVRWINSNVAPGGPGLELVRTLLRTPKIRGALRRCGLKDNQLKAYAAYLILKPIESLLLRFTERPA